MQYIGVNQQMKKALTNKLTKFIKRITQLPNAKNNAVPLKDHSLIPNLVDVLSRQECHHLLLVSAAGDKVHFALLDSLSHYLNLESNTPKSLQEIEIVYFDVLALALKNLTDETIKKDFASLALAWRAENKKVIFVLPAVELLVSPHELAPHVEYFGKLCKEYLISEDWRFIIFATPESYSRHTEQLRTLQSYLTTLAVPELSVTNAIALLKTYRGQLEEFHDCMLSEEIFFAAHTLAKNYLPQQAIFNAALQLLDSSAARCSAQSRKDLSHKPIVTTNMLMQVVASKTQIPLSFLQNNKFRAGQFVAGLRKKIFGHDEATQAIANLLQNAYVQLEEAQGPLATILLAGPSEVGKTSLAHAIVENLFGNLNNLVCVNLNKMFCTSLSDLMVSTHGAYSGAQTLLTIVEQLPCAVILLENIDVAPAENLELFADIIRQGFALDEQNKKINFQQTIILMTANVTLASSLKDPSAMDANLVNQPLDLMQLVLNDQLPTAHSSLEMPLSMDELYEKFQPQLSEFISPAVLPQIDVIALQSLDYSAIEKIVRGKIKNLTLWLDKNYHIELSCATEVVKHLAQECYWRRENAKPMAKILKQELYSCITHEILAHADDKDRGKRLIIQLNESGNLLRCEFAHVHDAVT
jgi:ATP-dependent Clp protease ATP-binding subunit ClpA